MKRFPSIQIWKSRTALEQAVAEKILESIRRTLKTQGRSVIALSGGETPRAVYHLLGADTTGASIDWNRVHIFFCDERIVPPSDPQSNFGMIHREWLSHIPFPQPHVHRILGEKDPGVAALEYEKELKGVFAPGAVVFDLVLLGVGEDGHTASIYPGTEVVNEREAVVKSVFVPHLGRWRVTVTLPVLNSAREVVFLVTGERKAPVVRRILDTAGSDQAIPASLIRPAHGTLEWMLDEKAGLMIERDVLNVVIH